MNKTEDGQFSLTHMLN